MAMYVERNNPNGGGPQPGGNATGSSPTQQSGVSGQNGSQGMVNGNKSDAFPAGTTNGSDQRGGIDYRDDLRELLDKAHSERGLTRYRLCKQMGIDSGTLSNVLAKRRHFSLEKLEQILGLLGYRLTFTQQGEGISQNPSMN